MIVRGAAASQPTLTDRCGSNRRKTSWTDLAALFHGFAVALTPFNICCSCSSASCLGVIIGVLPGLGGANGIAILLPLTFTMPPTSAIIMLSCIYWGALFGGAITSILFNIPGEPWSVATTFDGYPLAQQGRAGEALTAAFTSSFVGAFVAVLMITFLAPLVASFALQFGPPEFFSVYLLTFCSFVGMGKEPPFKIIASMMLGFALAAVGMDTVTGAAAPDLRPARADARLRLPDRGHRPVRHRRDPADDGGRAGVQGRAAKINPKVVLETWSEAAAILGDVAAQLRSIGCWMGITPGGATPASFMSYGVAQALLARTATSSAPASSKAWSRRRPRRTPPARARCCRC